MENRLDELYSVVQFVDDRRLPPAFRFFHRHRVVDEKGKVLGYKNLDQLRENLRPILLRRTRDSVLQQLPPRTNEIVRIPPTDEQVAMHASHMRTVSMITRKAYISEMDLLRLQKALLMCRMSADGTFLVDKQTPSYSSKLEYLGELLDGLFAEPGCKVVAVLRMDDDAQSDRAAVEETQDRLRAARRLRAAEETAGNRQSVPERPAMPAVHHHQRRFDGLESSGGQHGHQRRFAVESGRARTAHRPGASHGPKAAGASLRAGHGRDDRRKPAGHAFGQTRSGAGGAWMPNRT